MFFKTNNESFIRAMIHNHIFIWRKMKCTIQLGFAFLNRTFYISPRENICIIAHITIHYLYTIY